MLDTTILTATAAALGSLVGATSSIATTWITQRTQNMRAHAEWKLRERESLYKDFMTEASRLAIDALTNSLERPDQVMALYALLSRIRLISDAHVMQQGEACCNRIIDQYGQPNFTTDQLRAAVAAKEIAGLDPLREFSDACRKELLAQQI